MARVSALNPSGIRVLVPVVLAMSSAAALATAAVVVGDDDSDGVIKLTTPVLFSSLDGGSEDLDGVADGVLMLRALEIKTGGALLVDISVARIEVIKDIKLKGTGSIKPASAMPVGPILCVSSAHHIKLEESTMISVDGINQGGNLVLRADKEIDIKGSAAVTANSPAGVGGEVHFRSMGKIEVRDTAVISADGVTGAGRVSLCGAKDVRLKDSARVSANGTGSGVVGGTILLASSGGRIRLDKEGVLVTANGAAGGTVTMIACSKGGHGVSIQGRVEAIGSSGNGGSISADSRLSEIRVKGASERINATGTTADGTIVLTAGTKISLESATDPAATQIVESPSTELCECSLGAVIMLDLAAEAPSDPQSTLLAMREELQAAEATYPSLAEDMQLIQDKLDAALEDSEGGSLFSDPCRVLPSLGGDQVFLNMTRAAQRIQRLLLWEETFVDPEGEELIRPSGVPVPESLQRSLRDNLMRLLRSAALLSDIAIQEARGEPGAAAVAAAASADTDYANAHSLIGDALFLTAMGTFSQAWSTAWAVLPSPAEPVGAPPLVNILTPGPDASVDFTSIIVTGMVQDVVAGSVNSTEVSLHVNGVTAEVVNRSFLAVDVPIRNGPSVVVAVAVDIDGNRVTFCRIVNQNTPVTPQLVEISGNNQAGSIYAELPLSLAVQVNDADGIPLPDAQVIYRILQGDGGLGAEVERAVVVPTNVSGQALATWTLGSRVGVGVDRVRVTAVGIPGEVIFCARATGLPPENIDVVSGNDQNGSVDQLLPLPFVVVVTDAGQNPVADVPVTFTVLGGGGNFGGSNTFVANTNGSGRASGDLTLGPNTGLDNNLVDATFTGLDSEPASIKASAFVLGDPADTTVSGVVLDNQSEPVPGVTLSILGTGVFTTTNAQGQFLLSGAPVGNVFLEVDASTTTRPGVWANLEFELVTLPGVDNMLPKPIYILPLDLDNGEIVGGSQDVTILMPGVEGFALTVLAGSAKFEDGSTEGLVSVTGVTADKIPMPPGSGMQPRVIVTIQPPGVHFDPPAPITFPNADGLAPGTVTEMFSFDHDLGQFVSIGTGTVSEDGQVVASDPGFGIVKGGWHCSAPRSASGEGASLKVKITTTKPIELCLGATVGITASGSPPRDGVYTWTTSAPAVLSLDPQGGGLCENSSTCSTTATAAGPGLATVTVTFTCKTTGKSVTDTVLAMVTPITPADITVTAESGITEAMEGRIITFTANLAVGIPASLKPLTYTFHFTRPDGSTFTETVVSDSTMVDKDVVAGMVLDGDADHFFDTPISVSVACKGGEPIMSAPLSFRVFELWIEDFKDRTTGKAWKVVVGENIQYKAIASSDCTNFFWDMSDGVPDAWNPTGGNSKLGLFMVIPRSDQSGTFGGAISGDDFGSTYGTVTVECEDGEGNDHSIASTDLTPSIKAEVFFDPNQNTDGGAPSQDDPPNWYHFWKNGAVPGLDDFAYEHFTSYGSSQVLEGTFWDTHVLNIGIPANGTHYPNGLLVNGVQYGGAVGIDCCTEVVVHEKRHNTQAVAVNAAGGTFGRGGPGDTDPAGAPFTCPDSSVINPSHIGDSMPDAAEPALGLSLALKDTFNLRVIKACVYVGYGDGEFGALVAGFGATGVVAKDWSKGGKQW